MRVGMCTIQVVSRCFGDKVMKEKTERGGGVEALSAVCFAICFFFFFFFFFFVWVYRYFVPVEPCGSGN